MRKFLRRNYLGCWDFLVECRWFVVFAVGLFVLSFLVGFAWPHFFEAEIFAIIEEMSLMFEGLGVWETVGLIFVNNLMASFMMMVLGLLIGVFPLVACVENGYLAGFVSRYAAEASSVWVLWRLLPHGVFELPAVLISMGIGLRIGFQVLGVGGRGKGVRWSLKEGLRFFGFVVVPLLVVAAVVEGALIGFAN